MAAEKSSADAKSLLRQIGLEVAFLEPGRDATLLAELLARLAVAVGDDGPPAIVRGLVAARTWLGADSPGLTERLTTWHAWMDEATTSAERGQRLPSWPDALDAVDSFPSRGATPSPAPPAAPVAPSTDGRSTGGRPARSRLDEHAECQAVTVLPEGHDDELMRMFCVEAEELLAEIEAGVLVLEQSPTDEATLATVFRGFHTLKGNAAVMKLVVLQRLTHELESLLDAARRGRRPLDRAAIDVILAAADVVNRYVQETTRQLDGHDAGRSIPLPVPALIDRVHQVLASPSSDTPRPASPAATPAPAPIAEHAPVSLPAGTPTPTPEAASASVGQIAPTLAAEPVERPRVTTSGSVRVDTHKLDGLVDLVGELVIAQSMVVQAADAAAGDDTLARSLGHLRGITADLQRTAMAMRMIPIRGSFQKMSRLVRDVAVHLGKEISLVVEGEETEVDRTVIEEIGDPLVHMVRNAADHGIEQPAERTAAGKPASGTISLRAFHQGGFVVIQIADDGRGLDPNRLRQKAIERGLIPPGTTLDDREALELIFAPGFSTAEQVTDVSGRGVGMDVVRRNIERVRGKVEIESVPSRGTCFTISMPLTLAIIEGLIVSVAGQRFVIPTLAVRESFRPAASAITTVHSRGELVDVRGRQVPLLRLGRHLGIPGGIESPDQGIVVVLEAGFDCRGLLVDDLVGKQEVVIKGLGETFSGRPGFAGAAILGDGRIGLILDTTALVRLGRNPSETAA